VRRANLAAAVPAFHDGARDQKIPPPPLLCSIDDVARLLATSRRSVYRLISSGDLRVIRPIGNAPRVPYDDVQRLVARHLDELEASPDE
jgi:excisionase family DNA binding protein